MKRVTTTTTTTTTNNNNNSNTSNSSNISNNSNNSKISDSSRGAAYCGNVVNRKLYARPLLFSSRCFVLCCVAVLCAL